MPSNNSFNNLNEIQVNIDKSIGNKEKKKQRIIELLSLSTAHGIPNIIKTDNLLFKIIWLIVLVISTGTGSYYVIDSIFDYLKFQTVTNIKVIEEKQSQFPTLTFCGEPSFNNLTIDQIIMSSIFESVYENNLSKIFTEFNDTIYGKCFRYNSGKNIYGNKIDIINTTVYGKPNNLRIGFNLDGTVEFREILIQIHNHTSPPYDLENGGYWLKTGSVNYFEIERVFNEKLPEPYNDCLEDVDSFKLNKTIIDYIKELEKSYSQIECYRLCSHLFSMQESNCSCSRNLKNFEADCLVYPNDPLFNSEIKKCVANYLKTFRVKEQFEKCRQFCPKECDSMNYIINNYYKSYPNKGTIRNSGELSYYKTYETLHDHYIRLFVYFTDLKYTLISESPKTETFSFISSIGGILGLFLGISFLSLIEIFEIAYEIFFYLITIRVG